MIPSIQPASIAAADNTISTSLYIQQFRPFTSVHSTDAIEEMVSLDWQREAIEVEFNRLLDKWREERSAASSFVVVNATHPAYQRIIGMGPRVLPFIVRELERKNDHWYWALKAISGEDPVTPESRGRMREMRDAWLRWAREKHYAR
jgi:hypothetical protein